MRKKSSIRFVQGDMHKKNVGPRGNVMVVVIVVETVLWANMSTG